MDATAKLIDDIIRREGGFVDHPADRGGPTKHGITQRTLSRWYGRAATRAEVEALGIEEARQIYRRLYIDDPGFGQVFNFPLQAAVVDAGVHHGQGTATRWLQDSVGAKPDGIIGPLTVQAMRSTAPDLALRRLVVRRVRFIADIVARDATQLPFLRGWISRAVGFLEG